MHENIRIGPNPVLKDKGDYIYFKYSHKLIIKDFFNGSPAKGKDLVHKAVFDMHETKLTVFGWDFEFLSDTELNEDLKKVAMDYLDLKGITSKEERERIARWIFPKYKTPDIALRRVMLKKTEFRRTEMMKFCQKLGISVDDYCQWKIRKGQEPICFNGSSFQEIIFHTHEYLER